MAIIHVTQDNFKELINGDKLVLVDFFANWCGPCKMLGPIVEQVSNERDDCIIAKCDVDECGAIAQQYGIMSIPTMILFKNGVEVERDIGLKTKDRVEELINTNL